MKEPIMKTTTHELPFDLVATTAGDGFHSRTKKEVRITGIKLIAFHDEVLFGEMHVQFDPATWNVQQHGLIYTDRQFLRELKAKLLTLGFTPMQLAAVGYSTQGRQGDTYVELDAGAEFTRHFMSIAKEIPE